MFLSLRWDLNPGLSPKQLPSERVTSQLKANSPIAKGNDVLLNLRVTSSGSDVMVTCYEPSRTSLCLLAN